jgi:hypothetical protein
VDNGFGGREGFGERERQRLGWLLAAAHGYSVRDAAGERLGRVAWLRYGRDDRWPDALMVRPSGWRVALSWREREVPFTAVRSVAPERGEVLTDLEPLPHPGRQAPRLLHRGAATR